jgi:hypothetical protein
MDPFGCEEQEKTAINAAQSCVGSGDLNQCHLPGWPSYVSTTTQWDHQPMALPSDIYTEISPSIAGPHPSTTDFGSPYVPPNTTTVWTLLLHSDATLRDKILYAKDIDEIERVANFFTDVGSYHDSFKLSYSLLSYLATKASGEYATPRLSYTAFNMIRNARALWDSKKILNLLSLSMHQTTKPGSRDDEYWRLLLSFFGIVLQGSVGNSQKPLAICHAAAENFGTKDPPEKFNWRYLVLISNSKQLCRLGGRQYDEVSAWRDYYLPRKFRSAISDIRGYVESIAIWCVTALDDTHSWEAFSSFGNDLWTNTRDGEDILELECKILFCYFLTCLERKSKAAVQSECHTQLQSTLESLSRHFGITTSEALSTIARMLMYPSTKPFAGHNDRSDLIRRAFCGMKQIRNLTPPLGILINAEWGGCLLSATFIETLAFQYCYPYRFSDRQYRQLVDSQIQDFADRYFQLQFSADAFTHDPFAGVQHVTSVDGLIRPSLSDLIVC